MLVEPSPKKQSETDPVPSICALRAVPQANGRWAPTTANDPSAPTPTSVRCMDPPLPRHSPSAFPRISAMARSSGAPIASTAPWPRYVQVIVSPSTSALQAPTATASCPWHRCVDPRTRLRAKRRITSSSNARISSMRRCRSRSSSAVSSRSSSAIAARLRPPGRLEELDRDPVRVAQVERASTAVDAGVDLDRRADEGVDPGGAKPLVQAGQVVHDEAQVRRPHVRRVERAGSPPLGRQILEELDDVAVAGDAQVSHPDVCILMTDDRRQVAALLLLLGQGLQS